MKIDDIVPADKVRIVRGSLREIEEMLQMRATVNDAEYFSVAKLTRAAAMMEFGAGLLRMAANDKTPPHHPQKTEGK